MKYLFMLLCALSLLSCNKQENLNFSEVYKEGFDTTNSDFIIINDKHNVFKLNFQNDRHDLKGEILANNEIIPIKNIEFSEGILNEIREVEIQSNNDVLVKFDSGNVLFTEFKKLGNIFNFKGILETGEVIEYSWSHKMMPVHSSEEFAKEFYKNFSNYAPHNHLQDVEIAATSRLTWSCVVAAGITAITAVSLATINHCRSIIAEVSNHCTACLEVGLCSASCVTCPPRGGK